MQVFLIITASIPLLFSSLTDKRNWTFTSKLTQNGVIKDRYFKAEYSRGGEFPVSGGVWEEKKKKILSGFNNSDSSSELLREITSWKEKKNIAQVRQAKGVNYNKYSLSFGYRNLLQGYQNIYLV